MVLGSECRKAVGIGRCGARPSEGEKPVGDNPIHVAILDLTNSTRMRARQLTCTISNKTWTDYDSVLFIGNVETPKLILALAFRFFNVQRYHLFCLPLTVSANFP